MSDKPEYFVQQGKFDCSAATLAMLTGHTRQTVVQAMACNGWHNDMRGCTTRHERATVRDLGFDLVPVPQRVIVMLGRDLPDGVASNLSLNYPGYCHAMTWRDGKLWDPNTGRPGRKFWAPDSDPLVAVRWFSMLCDRPLAEREKKESWSLFRACDTYEEALAVVDHYRYKPDKFYRAAA